MKAGGGGARVSVAHFSLSCPATNLIKKFLHPFFSHFSIVVVLIALLNFLMRESAKIAKRQKQKEMNEMNGKPNQSTVGRREPEP